MIETLARQVRDKKVVLFAGAGLSAPLGLPAWKEFMDHMAQDLGYDPEALAGSGANYLQIAEFYRLEKGSISCLQSWMSQNWRIDDDRLRLSRVHNQIVDLDFRFIYTTNFDQNIERVFELRGKSFSKVISMLDVAEASAEHPHIVKFHGDFSDEASLVLTESDYFDRLNFESPLDIKFRSDVLGRSILFIGYSLADPNLRLLLYRMQQLWDGSGFADRRPKSYILLMRPDPVQERVFTSRGVTPIVYEGDKPTQALSDLLESLLKAVRNGA